MSGLDKLRVSTILVVIGFGIRIQDSILPLQDRAISLPAGLQETLRTDLVEIFKEG